MRILVYGAGAVGGYIGGRLVPRLLEAGYRVRVLVRDPTRLQGRPWLEQIDVHHVEEVLRHDVPRYFRRCVDPARTGAQQEGGGSADGGW